MSEITIDPIALEASLCRDSFYEFVKTFWDTVIPEPYVDNWHVEAICGVLQEAALRVWRREPLKHDIIINVPPGTSKSTICSVMFPAWVWTFMPWARTICTSYSHGLSLDLARRSRDVVVSDRWKALFGDIELREDQNAKGFFLNNKGGFRYCTSTGGTTGGLHAHFVIWDDPLDPNRPYSEAELKEANHYVGETLPTRKVDKKVALTIGIMQRLNEKDPSALVLAKAKEKGGTKVKHINLPAEIEGTGLDVVRPRKFAGFYVDGLLDCNRLSRDVLDSMRTTLGPTTYAAQMLQRPTPPGGALFKVSRIHLESGPLRAVDYKMRVRAWDKAGTDASKGKACYTVGVLMGLDYKGEFWVIDVVRGRWESNEREDRIYNTALLDGKGVVVSVEQEPGSGGKESAEATVRRLAGFRVRVYRPTGDKTMRADPYSVQVNAGNVHCVNAAWTREYLNELEFCPHGQYWDQVDASSQAFAQLTQKKVPVGALFTQPRSTQSGPVVRFRRP